MNKICDDFFLKARVLPAITIVSPMIVMALYKGVLENEWKKTTIGCGIAIVIIIFVANIVRELGKICEKNIYKELGAMPTTIIQRFSDNRITEISKVRYHKWLNSKMQGEPLPLSLEEEINDKKSDSKYDDASTYLRTYANAHRAQTPRVYQELKKYNYWKNLYGCKYYAIPIYIFFIIREVILIDNFRLKELFINPLPKYGIFIGMLIWCIGFLLIVSKKTVKKNAFDYAKALIEIINIIE